MTSNAGSVRIDATRVPLADVLAALATSTGLEIVYDGTPPPTPITALIEDTSSARALVKLLQGTGLNYLLVADKSGRNATTLLVSSAEAAPRQRSRRPPPVPEPGPEPQLPFAEPEIEDDMDDDLGDEPEAAAPAAPFDPTHPFRPPPAVPLTLPSTGTPPGSTTQPPALSREEVLRQRLEQLRADRQPDPDDE